MTERDKIALLHVLDHTRELLSITNGRSRDDLNSDRLLSLSVVRLLEIIGEAAKRVSEETRRAYPQIPWPQLIGLRNRLIHGYDAVDLDIVWRIVTADAPALLSELERIPVHE